MKDSIIICIFIIVFASIALVGIKYKEHFTQVSSSANVIASLSSDLDKGTIYAPLVSADTGIQVGSSISISDDGKINANDVKAQGTVSSSAVQANKVEATNINAQGTIDAKSVSTQNLCVNGTCLTQDQMDKLIKLASDPTLLAKNNPVREYPPIGIPPGNAWVKDTNDQVQGVVKYKVNATNVGYGNGEYVAWANSVWDYRANSREYNPGEWPASGAFDKRGGGSGQNSGWHIWGGHCNITNAQDYGPFILSIKMPVSILLRSYKLQTRTDGCCPEQMPSKWRLEASTDGNIWDVVDTRNGVLGWRVGEEREFSLDSIPSKLYNNFRLVMYRNSSSGPNCLHVGEWRLFGSTI